MFNLPHYTTTIEESSVIGKRVKQVYATDRDSGDNGRIEYFLDDDPSEFFVINQYSGWVSVARPMSGVSSVSLCLSILFTNLFFHDYHRSGHILGGLPGKRWGLMEWFLQAECPSWCQSNNVGAPMAG